MTGAPFWRAATSLLLALAFAPGMMASAQQSGLAPAAGKSGRPSRAAKAGVNAPSPFRITGRVINSLSKSPVGRAEVTVSPMGARRSNGRFAGRSGGQTAAATTDAEGRFAVEVPSAGGWSLSVAAHGFHTQTYDEHEGYSTAILLTEAHPVYAVTFGLTPGAAIEGYVLDEAGEAVRNAQVTLSMIPPATPEELRPRVQGRGTQRTDDRGYYKFSGLLSGSYGVRVQAEPWYASNGGGLRGGRGGAVLSISSNDGVAANPGSSAPDPLDVVYPMVWFPGVTDFSAATPISLRGGETRTADFRLLPVAGFYLRVPSKSPSGEGAGTSDRRLVRSNTYLTQVLPDGTETQIATSLQVDANGTTDFAGLAPGTYVIHRQGDGTASTATLRIAENSVHTVDASQAIPGVRVTVKVDAAADVPQLQVSFRDVESGRVIAMQGQREAGRRGGRRGGAGSDDGEARGKEGDATPRSIELQAGRYEVVLGGINDLHLTGIEAKDATAVGRTVTIAGGSPELTLHVAGGRADITGLVQANGEPVAGAMVLLVPATLGDPSGLDVIRRDQSNTDGSFDMTGVLPGAYILVAIEHGWDLNWSDPATLRGFLLHGLPLDLGTAGARKETIEAQSP